MMTTSQVETLIGASNAHLLTHECKTVNRKFLHLPRPAFIDEVFSLSNRNTQTLRALAHLFNSGRLSGTGYLSILPVDQGVEHSAGASFALNPMYFDPEKIIQLALEGGCNAVASTIGGLGMLSRKYAHKIPFIVKLNHNELLTFPNKANQILFGSVRDAWNLGATGVGATVYFGSDESERQITEIASAFEQAHALGMFTVLWCYLRNKAFKQPDKDLHLSADLTDQANYLGVTIQADIVKQKLPETNGGYLALNTPTQSYGKYHDRMYTELSSPHPVDLCRYQVLNCFMGRAGLINSGGASRGASDRKEAIISAIVNKRAGGMGLILGRKAFQCPFADGVSLLHDVQDIYTNQDITVA